MAPTKKSSSAPRKAAAKRASAGQEAGREGRER